MSNRVAKPRNILTIQKSNKKVVDAFFAELNLDEKKNASFKKITEASLGQEAYIIVKTENLEGIVVEISVNQGKEKGLVEKDKAIKVLQNDIETGLIKGEVGKGSEDYTNKTDFKDWAIIKVRLQPKTEADVKSYSDSIKSLEEKNTNLFLIVYACESNEEDVVYLDENGEEDQRETPNFYLNGENLYFKLLNLNVCPVDPNRRSHFVIHCTAGKMSEPSIKTKTKFDIPNKKKRSAAHIYVNLDGSKFEVWPLTEKNVWATKIESKKGLKGQMFHIELNYGAPTKPTNEMYNTLAELYIKAAYIEACWPTIVPHIEIDRGIADGHQDPTDFDYNYFYKLLKDKNIPVDDIPKFEHDRYWGHKSYKVPWSTDKTNWPPKLKGNPHK